MLRHVGILVMIYLGVVAHCSLVPADIMGMGRPFLPAILLVFIAAACHPALAIVWAGFVGFLLDGLSTERLGIQVGLAAMLGLGLQLTHSLWRSRSLVAMIAMSMLACVTWRALSPMTQAILAGRVVDPHSILTDAVQDAAWTAVVAFALMLGLRLISHGPSESVVKRPAQRWSPAVR